MKKTWETIGALFGALIVAGQLAISLPAMQANGMSMAGGLVQFFSFFTILTNSALLLFYLASLLNWNAPLLRSAKWRTAMALYITIVAFIYFAILADIWDPQNIFKVLDISLHYIAPALYVLYWVIFVPHGEAAFRHTPRWLVPGLAYVVYVLIRGALTGLYPYPFLDAGALGYLAVARNIIFLLFFFFIVGLIFVGIDRLLARLKTHTSQL